MLAPEGAPGPTLKESVFAGISGSVALAVNVSSVPSFTVWLGIAASVGAELTSVTRIVIVRLSLWGGAPLSVTRTVTRLIEGPCASAGVQVNTPVFGSIIAPAGAPGSRLKLRVSFGRSGSV